MQIYNFFALVYELRTKKIHIFAFMQTTLIMIGKTDDDYLKEGMDIYAKRIPHYTPFEIKVIPDIKNSKNLSQDQQKLAEAQLFLANIQQSDLVVLLDENGKMYTSRQFSQYINNAAIGGTRRLVFLIGGPYGFDKSIYERANHKISLSPMTFSHQMVRLIFLEQLYRAHTILKGQPYHHD